MRWSTTRSLKFRSASGRRSICSWLSAGVATTGDPLSTCRHFMSYPFTPMKTVGRFDFVYSSIQGTAAAQSTTALSIAFTMEGFIRFAQGILGLVVKKLITRICDKPRNYATGVPAQFIQEQLICCPSCLMNPPALSNNCKIREPIRNVGYSATALSASRCDLWGYG